ncbi:MAG TPA: PEGA domain-containing protein [Planctomycetes bacterium]|nr:PEGA domain-containing protein [Planctomycetaceae bacterium]HIM29509.1 PEGA domain-containing protein [Planctomycetota bacterium]
MSRNIICIAICLAVVCSSGCVRRRLTVRTNVPGAQVAIDNREIGVTPVSVPFTYYGGRNFVVTKAGCQTVRAQRDFGIPWYEFPVIDFFVENLWPYEIRDDRVVYFELIPSQPTDARQLVSRGEDLRNQASAGQVIGLPVDSR